MDSTVYEMERVIYNVENNIPSEGLRISNLTKFFKSNTTTKLDEVEAQTDNKSVDSDETNSTQKEIEIPDAHTAKKGHFRALNKIYFEVEKGELLSILGHNGAGKSTLINIIIGLLSCSEGDVFIKGQNTRDYIGDIY